MVTKLVSDRPGETDGEIIGRSVLQADTFAALFDRHAPHIHRYIARRLGPDTADDLLSETFTTAFKKRGQYDVERADARPWLYGIATNCILQHRRAEANYLRRRARLAQMREDSGDYSDDVASAVSAQSTRTQLLAALATLAPGDRDVLLLVAWDDLSYQQVAEALGIRLGTVKSRLNRARRQMQAALSSPFRLARDGKFGDMNGN